MTSPNSSQEAQQIFNRLLERALPRLLKESINNIREAVVTSYIASSRIARVRLMPNNDTLDVVLARDIVSVAVNDRVLLINPDKSNSTNYYIVSVLGAANPISYEYGIKASRGDNDEYVIRLTNRNGGVISDKSPVNFFANNGVLYADEDVVASIPGGTGWFGLGLSQLRGQTVQLFLYVVNNSNSGKVNVIASRIDAAKRYNEFGVTSIDQQYGFVGLASGEPAPAGNDVVSLAGRINANMSGTPLVWQIIDPAPISWPINSTDILTFAPIWTGAGTLTYTNVTGGDARAYRITNGAVQLLVDASGTVGGIGNIIKMSLPMNGILNNAPSFHGFLSNQVTVNNTGLYNINGLSNEAWILRSDSGNLVVGTVDVRPSINYPYKM